MAFSAEQSLRLGVGDISSSGGAALYNDGSVTSVGRGGAGGGEGPSTSSTIPAPRPRTVVPEHRMNKFFKILADPVVRETIERHLLYRYPP